MNPDDLAGLRGWDYLDAAKLADAKKRAGQKAYEIDSLAAAVFGTQEGKRLLRWMLKQTVLRPTVTPTSTEFAAGIREGQNDLVRQILAMIERAKKGPPL